jgi:heptose I phosphotransferase
MNDSLIPLADGYRACPEFAEDLRAMGLNTVEDVFAFQGGTSLTKKELTAWRNRMEFVLPGKNIRCFLKRYNRPPIGVQLRNWLGHGKRALTAEYDVLPCRPLNEGGIGTYQPIAYGGRWNGLWEEKSFAILREIPNAQSLEKKLPDCFLSPASPQSRKEQLTFLYQLADFARRFHATGYCHRDFYLCHIFYSPDSVLSLIDLQRAFVPKLFRGRWILKDLSQLYYSAPGDIISRADRLRFYLRYIQKDRLNSFDRQWIRKLKRRAWRMADRDIRRGKEAPFAK